MKKNGLIIIIMLLFTACEGDMGPMGPPGVDGEGVSWKIVELEIFPEDWRLDGNINKLNSRFIVEYPLRELTETVFLYGAVSVFYYPNGKDNIKTPLPYITHYGIIDNESEQLWTETFHYDVGIGDIAFYLTYSDFSTNLMPDKKMVIDVVLLW